MRTVAIKKDLGRGRFERFAVEKDVYYYIRQIEVALSSEIGRERLNEDYPERFPPLRGTCIT